MKIQYMHIPLSHLHEEDLDDNNILNETCTEKRRELWNPTETVIARWMLTPNA